MSAQETEKKGHKHSPEKGPQTAGQSDSELEQEEAVTEPEEVQPKSKAKPESATKSHSTADARREEAAHGKGDAAKGRSMAEVMRFSRRAGKRRG